MAYIEKSFGKPKIVYAYKTYYISMDLKYRVVKKNEFSSLKHEIANLKEQLEEATDFIREIEKGNVNIDISDGLNQNKLGKSLVSMRDHLTKIASEEKERNWTNTGLAKFVEILRNTQSLDFKSLSENILINLVKYIDANQGAIFVLEDEIPEDAHLRLIACYAYDRKKHLNKRIDLGDGLAGQCVLEKEQILLSEIPPNYIQITSGLGDASPSSILISPLMINEKVFGVVELASFNKFHAYQIEFINRLSESVASTIKNIKDSERTQNLLMESQEQAEKLRSQEEEMRQNLEEMQTTQEEMARKNIEIERASAEAESILKGINSTMATISFKPDGTIIDANNNFLKTMQYTLPEIKGKHHRIFVPADISGNPEYKQFWVQLSEGIFQKGVFKQMDSKGEINWFNAVYSPVLDAHGHVVKIMNFATDITAEREREEKISQMLDLSKAQEEEMARLQSNMEKQNFELQVRENVFDITTILSEADLKGNIIYANKKLAEVSKYTIEEMMGKPHNMFRHPDMPKELFKLFWETIKKGEIFKGIIKNKGKDGSIYWVDGCFVPVKDQKGNIVKYVGARYHIVDDKIGVQLYNEQAERLGLPKL